MDALDVTWTSKSHAWACHMVTRGPKDTITSTYHVHNSTTFHNHVLEQEEEEEEVEDDVSDVPL